jgi:hypothetical protein
MHAPASRPGASNLPLSPPARPSAETEAQGTLPPPSLEELRRELAQFDREAEDRRRFRTETKDLREGLSQCGLRERIGPFLVRVEKFSTQFIRGPGDAELGRSLFTPWISHLVGSAAEPAWRIGGGFELLQAWCWQRYRDDEARLRLEEPEEPSAPDGPTPLAAQHL